jgi:hypothetical protein
MQNSRNNITNQQADYLKKQKISQGQFSDSTGLGVQALRGGQSARWAVAPVKSSFCRH